MLRALGLGRGRGLGLELKRVCLLMWSGQRHGLHDSRIVVKLLCTIHALINGDAMMLSVQDTFKQMELYKKVRRRCWLKHKLHDSRLVVKLLCTIHVLINSDGKNHCNDAACAGYCQAEGTSQGGAHHLLAKAQGELVFLETQAGCGGHTVASPCNLHA